MKRHKRHFDLEEDANRWVISYADFITLLFCFFVVMYAISSVNVKKYKIITKSVTGAFNTKTHSSTPQVVVLPSMKSSSAKIKSPKLVKTNISQQKATKPFLNLNSDLKSLNTAFFAVRGYDGWYELEISSEELFDSAKAIPSQKALRHLTRLAGILKKTNSPIAIEGYTDNLPIHTLEYPSNWELSAARAASIARILVENGIKPSRLSATGFAYLYPVASNKTKAGRARNRRVVLVVAEHANVRRLLNPKVSTIDPKDGNLPHYLKSKKEVKFIKTMKEVRTKSGGIKFTQSIEEEKPKTNSKNSSTNAKEPDKVDKGATTN